MSRRSTTVSVESAATVAIAPRPAKRRRASHGDSNQASATPTELAFSQSGTSPPKTSNTRSELASVPSSLAPTPAFLYDIKTTATLMSTTCWAVRELCRSGRLKFVRVGHRWLVSTSAIQDFIKRAEQSQGDVA
jgi:excisionase family DNA binding protein